MKIFRPLLLSSALMLAGCAGTATHTDSASSSATWWDPVSWSWSSLSPARWFASSLEVSEQGVGKVNSMTTMQQQAIDDGLKGRYSLRKGMRSADGTVVSFWQAIDEDKQVKLELSGQRTVDRIAVTDSAISTSDGVKLGTSFSKLYRKAYGVCQKGSGGDSGSVICRAPGSQHISYLFSGEWHGPEGLMPADETLKSWTLSKIIWQR